MLPIGTAALLREQPGVTVTPLPDSQKANQSRLTLRTPLWADAMRLLRTIIDQSADDQLRRDALTLHGWLNA